MNLACVTMKMTMNEALVAGTLHAAGALGRERTHGSLEVGKHGDLLLLNAPRWEHLIYQLGDPPIQCVFKNGRRVFSVTAPSSSSCG
jgi:imidazolonepropionase